MIPKPDNRWPIILISCFVLGIVALAMLEYVPTVVLTGVISGAVGAAIALYGTNLQNRAGDLRQTELLTFQRTERLEDRELELKRQVFLEGLSGFGKLQRFVLSFANIETSPLDEASTIETVADSLNKLSAVCKKETLTKIYEAQRVYLSGTRRLIGMKIDLSEKLNQQKQLVEHVDRQDQRANPIREALWETRLSPTERDVLSRKLNAFDSSIETAIDQNNELSREMVPMYKDLFEQTMSVYAEFSIAVNEVVFKIRNELGIEIDESEFRELSVEAMNTSSEEAIEWFNKRLKTKYDQEVARVKESFE